MAQKKFKCVAIGDGEVGKTSLLMTYALKKFPAEYVPTVFENYNATIDRDGQSYSMILFDTAGQELHKELRQLSYEKADVFLLCFSIASPESFGNVKDKWFPELQKHSQHAKVILVGTKQDLREDEQTSLALRKAQLSPVREAQGQTAAADIQAISYMECSAKLESGVQEVFQSALDACLDSMQRPKKSTSLCCCCFRQ